MRASGHEAIRPAGLRLRGRPASRPISLLASGGAQFAGQVLGILIALLVSHLIARRMGAASEADAFILGRRLATSVSEVLNQVVVVVFFPVLAARLAAGASATRALGHVGGAAIALGALLAGLLALAAPIIVAVVAPEFDTETAVLAARVVTLLAVALPASVATIAFAAFCNLTGRFGIPAALRQAPRAAVAVALALGGSVLAVRASIAYAAAFFAVAALTLAIALHAGRRLEGPARSRSPSVAVGRLSGAAALLTLGALSSVWLETAFAARQGVGAVVALDLSQRLGALCGNTLATALGLAAFAEFSRRAAEGDAKRLARRFGDTTATALALLVPLQIGLAVNAGALVDVIVAHGAFPMEAAARVTELMRWMACAPVAALVARMLLMRVLAEQDLPIMRLVAGAVGLDVLTRLTLFSLLTPALGLLAIPAALTVAPLAPALYLAAALRRRGALVRGLSSRGARPALATAALVSAAVVAGAALGPVLAPGLAALGGAAPKLGSVAQLMASGLLGGAALIAGIRLFRLRLSRL